MREKIDTIPGLKVLSGSTNFIFFEILGSAKVSPADFASMDFIFISFY